MMIIHIQFYVYNNKNVCTAAFHTIFYKLFNYDIIHLGHSYTQPTWSNIIIFSTPNSPFAIKCQNLANPFISPLMYDVI